ncbi:MAG TPA: HEAT repeat domain-containing protein [Terriglobales bacterium]
MGFWFRAVALLLTTLFLGTASISQNRSLQAGATAQAWAVLHEGLTSDKFERRVLCVRSLSLMQHDPKAVEFSEQALDDRDRHVRAAAATTLGQLESYSSIPKLRGALNDKEVPVVLAAAHSLYLLKDPSAYDVYYAILMGDRKSSEGLVQSQLDRLRDPKQLMQLGFEEGIGFVPFGGMGYEAYRQIHGQDASPVRAVAARSLARDPDQISEDALIQIALTDKSEPVRLAALDALAERDDRRCIERLVKNLSEPKLAVRYRTAALILHLNKTGKRPPKKEK